MDILVVEDDFLNAKLIEKLLNKEGYSIDIANTYHEAKKLTNDSLYKLIILDWNLPDKSGYELLKELRTVLINSQILMLSANDDVEYRVKALNSGADDYLCKPYSPIELLARVRSILRRTDSNKSTSIKLGSIKIDKNSREITLESKVVNFTTAEYDIFERLASNPNKIFTKHELVSTLYSEYDASAMSNIIEVHISNIRKKLNNKGIIKTIRSAGYKIGKSESDLQN